MRALVVEDSPTTAEALALLLSMHGHEVTVARSVEEGLELGRAIRPDCAILDHYLLERTGLDLLRCMRSEDWGRNLNVVIATAAQEAECAELIRSYTALGAAVLRKPYQPAELLALLRAGNDQQTEKTKEA